MTRIQRLPENLINQIAAGEVVERPASVVKELVENSLDAGATRLDILLKDGGISEIQIIDNGSGMPPEDLTLSVERHATSKLRTESDLEAIATFGFRGEALASIASVSEIEVKSRLPSASQGYRVQIHFGISQGEVEPVGAPVGTSITVRNLFERVPARQKFLRSLATEFSHCSRIVKELALGSPGVSFFLQHQGKRVSQFVSPTREGRVRECLKPNWEPFPIGAEADGLKLDAYLSPPHLSQEKGELYLYINKRPVRNRGLFSAFRHGFSSALGPSHEPSGVVYLEIRLDWVDVNVHPQKWEVRCLGQEKIFGWLQATVRKALSQVPAPQLVAQPSPPSASPVTHRDREPHYFTLPPTTRLLRYLGKLQSSHLVCEDARGVLLVDPRALSEHIHLEQLKRLGSIPVRSLSLPASFPWKRTHSPSWRKNGNELREAGFEMEYFGDGDVAVKSCPASIPDPNLEAAFREILQESESSRDRLLELISAPLVAIL